MQICSLKLINFRNYQSLKIEFSKTLNIIYGNNGMGKTNLVEAIYVLALTKSFRTNNDSLLINKDQDLLKIEGEIKDKTINNFKLILDSEGKKVKINDNTEPKLSDYISKFRVILFSPADLRIIKAAPSDRRKYLNRQLSQLNNVYLKTLNKYNKILKQRNAYLKTMYINQNAKVEYLDILTEELINYGEKIYIERNKYFEIINEIISKKYLRIAGAKQLKIKYLSDYKDFDKEKLLKKYKNSENKDVILGKTHVGIHHDDYMFYLNEESLKDYGSEGQQKNAIIAYKLSEIELFYKQKESYPVLILDDLFSELDNEKIENIFKVLKKRIQTFITTTNIEIISEEIINKSKIFKVDLGNVEEEKT